MASFTALLARSFAAAAATLLFAGSAQAATLSLSAGSLSIEIANPVGVVPQATLFQDPDPISVSVSSAGGSFSQPAGIFTGSPILDTALFTGVPLISSLNLDLANGTGSFAAGGGPFGSFGGPGALSGSLHLGILGGSINLAIPLSIVGQTGGGVPVAAAALAISATGTGWTTGAAVLSNVTVGTPSGAFVNTVTLTGSDNRSAGHAGTLSLVTPMRILTNAGSFGLLFRQDLVLIPEPGTLVLLSAAAGLTLVGLRRQVLRRRQR